MLPIKSNGFGILQNQRQDSCKFVAKISVNPELEIHVNRALVFVLARAGARRDIAKPRKPAANYFIKPI